MVVIVLDYVLCSVTRATIPMLIKKTSSAFSCVTVVMMARELDVITNLQSAAVMMQTKGLTLG